MNWILVITGLITACGLTIIGLFLLVIVLKS